VIQRGHHELSTFNLIPDQPKPTLMAWIDQLVDQDLLVREGEYRVLCVTQKGWRVLRSEAEAMLREVEGKPAKRPSRPRTHRAKSSSVQPGSSAPHAVIDDGFMDADARALFETLRALRREIAEERAVPAFVVFSDMTLRAMARSRPRNETEMLAVKGVGPAKISDFGERFLNTIRTHPKSTTPA
jgi:ATP-dependent DNA helicase RecQ